ncbi:MAG: LysE family translocator [Bacteroidales bacterium]|nr:LysE family translocator [Bacteroidales bacterium]MBD5284347.1 LysE family translocator [Bacteroides sp.]
MMMVRGVAIGAIISAPMGPVGILCVQRTLNGGRRHGFFTGIGASISDLIYCLLTGFGLSFIEEFLQAHQQIIQLLGSVVLIGFGIYIMRKNPVKSLSPPPSTAGRNGKDILSGFLFTFSNPLILFLIIGLFARFNFQSPEYHWYHYVMGYISIAAGAIGWWWLVTFAVNKVRAHFNLRSMWIINRVIGIVILIFAVYGIVSAFTSESKAEMHPAERIVNHQTSYSVSEPLPLEISAPGQEAGRFSFIEGLPDSRIVTGIDFTLTSINNSPTRSYTYTDTSGKTRRVRRPEVTLIWTDAAGHSASLTMNSAEPAGYDGEEAGGETKILLHDSSGKETRMKPLAGLIQATPFHIDVRDNAIDINIGNHETIAIPFYPPLSSFTLEVSPGGKVELENARIWTRSAPVINDKVAHREWSTPESIERSFRELTGERRVPSICGVWRLYESKEDETLMRRGGDYRILILPSDHSDGSLSIWMLGGANILASDWPCGRLKGTLSPTPYQDDWNLDWLDAEGHSCGPAARAHLTKGALTFLFPRHNTTLLFLRP